MGGDRLAWVAEYSWGFGMRWRGAQGLERDADPWQHCMSGPTGLFSDVIQSRDSGGRPGLESLVDVFTLSFARNLQDQILACQEAQAQSLAWY